MNLKISKNPICFCDIPRKGQLNLGIWWGFMSNVMRYGNISCIYPQYTNHGRCHCCSIFQSPASWSSDYCTAMLPRPDGYIANGVVVNIWHQHLGSIQDLSRHEVELSCLSKLKPMSQLVCKFSNLSWCVDQALTWENDISSEGWETMTLRHFAPWPSPTTFSG